MLYRLASEDLESRCFTVFAGGTTEVFVTAIILHVVALLHDHGISYVQYRKPPHNASKAWRIPSSYPFLDLRPLCLQRLAHAAESDHLCDLQRKLTSATRSVFKTERNHGSKLTRYSSTPYLEPSLPKPDSFTPPNGAAGSEIRPVLTPTIPTSRASATLYTRCRSPEKK